MQRTSMARSLLGPGSYSVEVDAAGALWERVDPIPEPATLTLLGVGLTGLGVIRRRRA